MENPRYEGRVGEGGAQCVVLPRTCQKTHLLPEVEAPAGIINPAGHPALHKVALRHRTLGLGHEGMQVPV